MWIIREREVFGGYSLSFYIFVGFILRNLLDFYCEGLRKIFKSFLVIQGILYNEVLFFKEKDIGRV